MGMILKWLLLYSMQNAVVDEMVLPVHWRNGYKAFEQVKDNNEHTVGEWTHEHSKKLNSSLWF